MYEQSDETEEEEVIAKLVFKSKWRNWYQNEDLIYSTTTQNLTILALAVPELWLVATKSKCSRDLTSPLSGMVYHPLASRCYD